MIKKFLVILFVVFLYISNSAAATVIESLPYDITVSGDYELSTDLSSATYGVYINANSVNLDLKWHTITFGTGNGEKPKRSLHWI